MTLVNRKLFLTDFDEAASDECFAAVLRAETSGTCQISDNCQDIMTRRHLSSYPMLHQILYSIVLESIPSCKAVWSQMLPRLVFQYLHTYLIMA